MQLALVVGKLLPVAVSAFGDDLSLFQQALEKESDLEFLVLRFRDTNGDVLEIDEQRDLAFIAHASWRGGGERVIVAAVVFLFENRLAHHE